MSSTSRPTRPQTHRSTGGVLASDQSGQIGTASATGMDPIVAIMVYLYETDPVKAAD